MSQLSIPSKDASKSPILSEIITETDSITESDPGDSGSVFKAPRASQATSQQPSNWARRVPKRKANYTQSQLSLGVIASP